MAKDDPKARILESLFVKGFCAINEPPRAGVTCASTSCRGNLSKALDELEKNDLMRDTLGDHIFDHFVAAKRTEWDTTSGTCRRGKSNAI
jgi:hypothetical protein